LNTEEPWIGEADWLIVRAAPLARREKTMRRIALFLAFILCAMPACAGKPAKVAVTISPTTATLYSAATKQFTAVVTGTTNTAVTWSTTAGTITSSGLYTAPTVSASNTAYVTATSVAQSTKKVTATVTINPAPSVLSRIAVSPASASIYVGATQQFSAVAYDQYGHTMSASLTYASTNYSVAAIDAASGIATGEAAGTANITAYSGNVVSNSVALAVNSVPPPSPLTVTRLSPNIGLVGMNGNFNSLTIFGTGFVSGATVNFGSTVLSPSAVTSTSVTVTVPVSEFSSVRSVQVSVTNPGTAPSASLPFSIINQGFVSLTFDDGYYSAYNKAIPILDAAGLKSTFYTITTLVGDTADGYVTQSQLQTLYKNGHEIGNHTRTHPALSTVSQTQLTSETSGAEQDLTNWGYKPTTFAYPYDDYGGSSSSAVVAAVKASGVRGARDSDYGGYNNATSFPLLLDSMPSEYDLGTDNVATVTGWIQQAVANKMWVIILWHRVDETDPNTGAPNATSVPSSVIQGVVNYIVANGIHVVTDSEGLVIENMDAQQ
jgi:peptidoglycan/xylan/chitin deacetylase (PgdA/CDA1 family)